MVFCLLEIFLLRLLCGGKLRLSGLAFRVLRCFSGLELEPFCGMRLLGLRLSWGVAAAVVFLQKKKPEKTVFLLPLWLLPRARDFSSAESFMSIFAQMLYLCINVINLRRRNIQI